jgi:hypothetical protein
LFSFYQSINQACVMIKLANRYRFHLVRQYRLTAGTSSAITGLLLILPGFSYAKKAHIWSVSRDLRFESFRSLQLFPGFEHAHLPAERKLCTASMNKAG